MILGDCLSYCLANAFSFAELKEDFKTRYTVSSYRDAIHIMINKGDAFIFTHGIVVVWALSPEDITLLLGELAIFRREPLTTLVTDEFSFEVTNGADPRIHSDKIYIPNSEMLTKLAISHGIAQSVKLVYLEEYAQSSIDASSKIPQSLAEKGYTTLSRRAITKLRGKLYLVESDINLKFGLLDTPEFFWEYPELEHFYTMISKYLDIKPRVEVLNKRLAVIRELLTMLAQEMNHKHSSILEWIVIWLIATEIFMAAAEVFGFLK
jgi:uncharacterized Rmd1/YagE family protein